MFCHDAHFNEPWPSVEICRAAIERLSGEIRTHTGRVPVAKMIREKARLRRLSSEGCYKI